MKQYIITIIAIDTTVDNEEYLSTGEIEGKIISTNLDAGLKARVLSIVELEEE